MKEVIEKAVSSLAIAAFIPSAAFVAIALMLFIPIAPSGLLENIRFLFDSPALFMLAATGILGFTLLNLKSPIYRFYRGYYLIDHIPFFNRLERRKAERLGQKIHNLESRFDILAQKNGSVDDELESIDSELYKLRALEHETFPSSDEEIQATRFGNILRAAEVHPAYCYGIDTIPIWPRLVQCLPNEQYERIEQANNQMAFSIYSSLLALILSIVCVLAAAYEGILYHAANLGQDAPLYFVTIDRIPEVYRQRILLYLFVGLFLMFLAWLFYRSALPLAVYYGVMFRSAFDLSRSTLLERLQRKLPATPKEERDTWAGVSEFLRYGDRFGDLDIEYNVAKREGFNEAAPNIQ